MNKFRKTYYHIPTAVNDWPTSDPGEARSMARAIHSKVKKFIAENGLDAMAVLATNDKASQISGGDPEVVTAIDGFVSDLLKP